VGGFDGLEGGANAVGAKPGAKRRQRVDHAGQTGESAEEDEAAALIVADQLVVDQGAAELLEAGEHGHVVGLALDDVREEHIGRVGEQALGRDLLDPEDRLGVGEVAHHRRAGAEVLLVAINPPGRRLEENGEVGVLHQMTDEVRGHGGPALPRALCFSTDSDNASHGRLRRQRLPSPREAGKAVSTSGGRAAPTPASSGSRLVRSVTSRSPCRFSGRSSDSLR